MIERRSAATIVLSRRERISGAAHPVRAYCVTGKAITRRGFPRGFRLPVRVREAFSNDNYSHRNGHGRVTDCQIANCLGAASPRSVALENAERRVKGDAGVIKHLTKVPSRAHVRQLRSAQARGLQAQELLDEEQAARPVRQDALPIARPCVDWLETRSASSTPRSTELAAEPQRRAHVDRARER